MTHLAEDQAARAAALASAREALADQPALGDAGAPDVFDLLRVARWIIDGREDWPEAEGLTTPDPGQLAEHGITVANALVDAIKIDVKRALRLAPIEEIENIVFRAIEDARP